MNSRVRWMPTLLASALVSAVLVIATETPAAADAVARLASKRMQRGRHCGGHQ